MHRVGVLYGCVCFVCVGVRVCVVWVCVCCMCGCRCVCVGWVLVYMHITSQIHSEGGSLHIVY